MDNPSSEREADPSGRSWLVGTNMTKWLCRLSLRANRAQGPFTTKFYNEQDPNDSNGRM
jgi:hypothetical protein